MAPPAGRGRQSQRRRLACADIAGLAGDAAHAADRARRALSTANVRASIPICPLDISSQSIGSDGITVTESISQIGRMVQRKMEGIQKVQALMMRINKRLTRASFSNFAIFGLSKLENLEEKVESMSHEVKKLARLHSNRHADKYPRSEPYQEGATLSEPNANIRLRFLDGLRTPIYTDKIITSQSNAAIRVGVFDGEKMINEGPLSKAKVEILVLRGDFCSDGQESWTEEEFNSHIAQGRHRQGSVLGGDCSAWLNNGEASLGKIRFREGSSRTPSRKFIVGGRVCMNRKIGGIRVQEAVMEPVTVLDRRNEANEKRHPPRLDDEVYRLEEISRDGIYHRRLKNVHIFTVEDFLKALNKDADVLREMVLEIKKRSNAWERMVKHARECCLADRPELKAYHSVEGNVVIFFNCVHDLVGAIFYGVYVSRDNFDPAKKAQAYELQECARGTAANENQLQDRINNITEPSHQNEYIHGDQSTVNTHYFQGESILPVGQQQPTIFTGELLHWPYESEQSVSA
uniref:Uncharacterized protein n=1 Tax=Aegilops tauschii TaxID=37682 RepID=M8C4A4_AEGTA